MARKKSIRDIYAQLSRIVQYGDDARWGKANVITQRYLKNIQNTKAYKKDAKEFDSARNSADSLKAIERMDTRKYSRNAYMGLANG